MRLVGLGLDVMVILSFRVLFKTAYFTYQTASRLYNYTREAFTFPYLTRFYTTNQWNIFDLNCPSVRFINNNMILIVIPPYSFCK